MTKRAIRGGAGFLALVTAAWFIVTPPMARAAIKSRSILKTYFETGDVPTQEQFGDLIDSYIHQTDDGLILVGMGVTPDGTPGGSFLRLGANVGINETMPDTYQSAWLKPPQPNIPPIPGMCPSFCGAFGFLPLMYQNLAGTETHYGFLQITMADDESSVPSLAGAEAAVSEPAIFVEHWVWESTPGATLTTFVVPEPTSAAILLLLGLPMARRAASRRRAQT